MPQTSLLGQWDAHSGLPQACLVSTRAGGVGHTHHPHPSPVTPWREGSEWLPRGSLTWGRSCQVPWAPQQAGALSACSSPGSAAELASMQGFLPSPSRWGLHHKGLPPSGDPPSRIILSCSVLGVRIRA